MHSVEQEERVHHDPNVLVVPWRKPPAKRPREIILPAGPSSHQDLLPIRAETRARLVMAIAKGRRWLDQLIAGTVTNVEQIATTENCTVRQVNMTISLAFLAPNLVQAAVDGRLPRGVGIANLRDRPNGPCNTRGSGSRRKHFPQYALRRQEQNFFGQRPGLEFGISRRPKAG